MALSQWTKLSQDAKDIWDTLTDEAKGIILDRQGLLDAVLHVPLFVTPTFRISGPSSWLTSMIFALEAKEMSNTLRKHSPHPLLPQPTMQCLLPLKIVRQLHCLSMPGNTRMCLWLTSVGSRLPRRRIQHQRSQMMQNLSLSTARSTDR
jgi:hypothetical protein